MEFSVDVNVQAESLLKSLLKKFDGNEYSFVKLPMDYLSAAVRPYVDELSQDLQREELISSYQMRGDNELFAVLTPKALAYFDDRKKNAVHEMMFRKLPGNSEQLLEKILDLESQGQDVAMVLNDNLNNLSFKQKDILTGILNELESYNLIEFTWQNGNIDRVELKKLGRSYFDRKEQYYTQREELHRAEFAPQQPEHTPGGEAVPDTVAEVRRRRLDLLGDRGAEESLFAGENQPEQPLFIQPQVPEPARPQVTSVDFTGYLNQLAEQRGGADTQQLKLLIEEVSEFVELLKLQKTVPDNRELWDKLQMQFQRHPWFLGEVTQLVGREVLTLLTR